MFVDPSGLCGCGGESSAWNQLAGAAQAAFGGYMMVGGAGWVIGTWGSGWAPVGVVVGAVVAAKGLDNFVHGVDQLFSGQESPTWTNGVLRDLLGSCAAANSAEFWADLALGAAAGYGWSLLARPLTPSEVVRREAANTYCFPAGTLVATPEGARAIERVESGEAVWSFDFRAGRWLECRVAVRHAATYEGEFLTLVFDDGTSLEVTADHPVWVLEGEGLASRPQLHERDAFEDSGLGLPGRWVHSQWVRVGDQLYGRGEGCLRVVGVRSRWDCQEVYNLSVLGLPYVAHVGVKRLSREWRKVQYER